LIVFKVLYRQEDVFMLSFHLVSVMIQPFLEI
jgi:hypothetical protein